jgi:tetratricopeptide (TPR) repeat protein
MPEVYTEQSLQDALRERLTEDELAMVINPIAGSEEMKTWAEKLTEGTVGDLDKAKAIFDNLSDRPQSAGGHGTRTAKEVFAACDNTDISFNCQENAKLFVALARHVDIKAFYVHVHRDYKDKLIHHDCAAVFTDGKTLLIDPSYHWFGAAHKEFIILNDLQTIAHQLFQPTGSGRTVARCRLAAKLHPDFVWGKLCLVGALCNAKEWDQARSVLDAALRLEPDYWECYMWRGIIANDYDDNPQVALGHIQKALELNPESSPAHFILATILLKQGKLREARDEFRAGLRYEPIPEQAETAYRVIAQINESIGIEHDAIETNELKINPPHKEN